jgi:hypothetical protein
MIGSRQQSIYQIGKGFSSRNPKNLREGSCALLGWPLMAPV